MAGIFKKIIIICFLILAVFFSFGIQSYAGDKDADLQIILNEMKSSNASVREDAVQNLSSVLGWDYLDTKKDEIIPHLIKLLKDENKLVRQNAAAKLELMDPMEREELIPIFVEAIKEDSIYAGRASSILERYGPKAKSAVPVIIEAMKKNPKYSFTGAWVTMLEGIGTPEALEAIKPYKRKVAMQWKLVRPIAIISGSRIGSSLMILGLLGLFVWGRIQRKKGCKLIGWPLFIPMLVWGVCIHEPVIYDPLFDVIIQTSLLVITLIGIIPWLISLWRWHKRNVKGIEI